MSRFSTLAKIALFALCLAFISTWAKADEVEYQVTPVSGNEWQYTYTLVGGQLSANEGLTVFFDPTTTSNLVDSSLDATDPGSPAANNWLSFVVPPAPTLSTDGYYTALALIDETTATAEAFTVTFDASGSAVPGSQGFSIDQFDSSGNLVSNVQTGQTTPYSIATPEPSSGLLLILGLAVIMGGVWRRRRVFQS